MNRSVKRADNSMNMLYLFAALALLLFILMFSPGILPRCSVCKKIKLRTCFKLYIITGILPGFGKTKAVCKKCSSKYLINTAIECEEVEMIRKKAEANIYSNQFDSAESNEQSGRKFKNNGSFRF